MELTNKPVLLWFVIIYFAAIIVMGFMYSKKAKTAVDFILAGKSLGPIILAGTLLATWCGSGTVTGGGNSLAFNNGFWMGALYGVPSIIGILILFGIAKKIKNMDKYTVAEILGSKYGEGARILAAFIVIIAYLGILSYQYRGLAFVLNVTTGIPLDIAIIVSAFVMMILALMGGLWSVAPTDAASAIMMTIGLVLATIFSFRVGGGLTNIVANLPEAHTTFSGGLSPLQIAGYWIPTLFLILGDQNMYMRITAAKEDKSLRLGMIGWLVGFVVCIPAIAFIATVARSIFGTNIQAGNALIAMTTVLPTFVGGLLLCTAAAFIITTGNSFLLSLTTNLVYDVYGTVIKKDASDEQKLKVIRILIPIMALLAYIILQFFPSILAIQMYSYTIYGAGLTPAILGAVLWKKATKAGGISSMLVGLVVTLVWETMFLAKTGIASAIVSIPIAIIVLIAVSLVTQKNAGVQNNAA